MTSVPGRYDGEPLPVVSSADFTRELGASGRALMWFMGAGCSASAGISTAQDMIADFKARLFASATNIPRAEIDTTDPLWLTRIESYFNGADGLPPAGDQDEYAATFEAVLPSAEERRSHIERLIRRGTPSFGHRVVACLICTGRIPAVFTTNFDPLVENATTVAADLLEATQRPHLTTAALDSTERAERALRENASPVLVKLHGDYLSVRLKNTSAEIQDQDSTLRRVLIEMCQRFGLLIIGYSGRDASVLDALRDALSRPSPFPGGLYWVVRPQVKLLPAASELLQSARHSGIDARLIESETFDEFCADMERQLEFPEPLAHHILRARPDSLVTDVALPSIEAASFPVLRCAALPILEIPRAARQISLRSTISLPDLRQLLRAAKARATAISTGTQVLAFGYDEDLLARLSELGARIEGESTIDPVNDSLSRGLLYDALARGLAHGRPLHAKLRAAGHALVLAPPHAERIDPVAARRRDQIKSMNAAYGDAVVGTVPKLGFGFAEGVRIRLEHQLDRWWVVFDPFTWVDIPRDEDDARASPPYGHGDPVGDWRRERWAQRYNPRWASIVDAWAKLLAPADDMRVATFGCAPEAGVDAVFVLGAATAWSRPAHAFQTGRP